MRRTSIIDTVTLALTILAATAAVQAASRPSLREMLAAKDLTLGAQVRMIHNYQVSDWTYLDEQHLLLAARPPATYLVTLVAPCAGLASSPAISFSTTIADLTDLDQLIVHDAAVNNPCPIRRIDTVKPLKKSHREHDNVNN